MPTTISVMSWNVQNLGNSKTTAPGGKVNADKRIVDLIAAEVHRKGIHVLGIMEIQSGIGSRIASHIVVELNGKPGSSGLWATQLSSRQDGGTQEEYLYVVDCAAGELQFNAAGRPAQSSLMGVFDESVINDFGTDAVERGELMAALVKVGYIKKGFFFANRANGKTRVETEKYRVDGNRWLALSTKENVSFPGPQTPFVAGLSDADLGRLKSKILDVDILKFTSQGDRSPFMMHLTVGPNNNTTPLTIVLAHQLGPSDRLRFDAINIMALNKVLIDKAANNEPILLMGDYNVAANQMQKQVRVYERRAVKNVYGLNVAVPAATRRIFEPIFGLSATNQDLLGAQATSLSHSFLMNDAPAADALSSAYDKLMLFNVPAAKIVASSVINLVSEYNQPDADAQVAATMALVRAKAVGISTDLTKKQKIIEDRIADLLKKNAHLPMRIAATEEEINKFHPPANSPLLKRLAKYKATLADSDKVKDNLQTQVEAAELIAIQLSDATLPYPKDIGTSLAVYSYAVSDHLPVSVTFTLG